jgi:hypothetical protein
MQMFASLMTENTYERLSHFLYFPILTLFGLFLFHSLSALPLKFLFGSFSVVFLLCSVSPTYPELFFYVCYSLVSLRFSKNHYLNNFSHS